MAIIKEIGLAELGDVIKYPTLCNRFKFGEWVGLSKAANNTLSLQLTSFEMNLIEDSLKYSGLKKTAKLIFEDSQDGTTFNAIQQLRNTAQLTIEIVDGDGSIINYLNMFSVSIKAINYKLGYSMNGVAEFIVDIEFIRTNRTVD